MAQEADEKKVEISPEEQKQLFENLKKKPFSSQGVFFLNIFWAKYENEKDLVFNLLAKFDEQNQKHGAKENCVQYPLFCKLLQQSEDNQRVKDALHKSGDKPSMSKAFQELGFKLGGDVTLIEALLFLFGEKVEALVGSPTSPADAALRQAKADLETELKVEKDLLDQKAALDVEIAQLQNENKPIKVAPKRQELAKLEETINKGKVDRSRRQKAAQKKVTDSEAALVQETAKGTDASNWWRAQCEENSISYFA